MSEINYKELTKNLEIAMKSFETITAQAFRTLKKEDPQMAERLMSDFERVKAAKNPNEITDLITKYANLSKQ